MKRILSHGLSMCVLMAALAMGASLEDLHKSFMGHYDRVNAQRDEQLKKLDGSYLAALDRQLEKAKATGNLETVIPFNTEIRAVKNGTDPLPALAANGTSELKQMRDKYLDGRDKVVKEHAESVVALIDKMEKELKAQEVALTKEGKLDAALAAKSMRESLANDAGASAARAMLKHGGLRGLVRPALQLRRFGDNLEVLVFHDRRGKISMESPIENVREKSGENKKMGATKAKVLGEFVGAKGFTVDPYVSYHNVFDSKDLGKFAMGELNPVFKHAEAGEKGLRLSMQPMAVNPYGTFGNVLPPATSKGTYRIICHYFIPKSNRAISGFQFVHGGGGAIGGQRFEKAGKWETGELTAESPNTTEALLFYLTLMEGKKAADAGDDYVVLGELKVEHLRFAAFVHQKFGDHGEVLTSSDDPQKQTLLISNGQFVQE